MNAACDVRLFSAIAALTCAVRSNSFTAVILAMDVRAIDKLIYRRRRNGRKTSRGIDSSGICYEVMHKLGRFPDDWHASRTNESRGIRIY